jgi:hypothetical protein
MSQPNNGNAAVSRYQHAESYLSQDAAGFADVLRSPPLLNYCVGLSIERLSQPTLSHFSKATGLAARRLIQAKSPQASAGSMARLASKSQRS